MSRSSSVVPVLVALALFLSIALAFASLLAIVSADESPSSDQHSSPDSTATSQQQSASTTPLPDDTTLFKMKVRQLKALLAKKGSDAECLACTSKQEFVDRIRETADWPDVEQNNHQKPGENDPTLDELAALFNKDRSPEEVDKIKRNLEAAGIDASNIFSTGGNFDAEAFTKQFEAWQKNRDAAAAADAPASGNDDSHVEL